MKLLKRDVKCLIVLILSEVIFETFSIISWASRQFISYFLRQIAEDLSHTIFDHLLFSLLDLPKLADQQVKHS